MNEYIKALIKKYYNISIVVSEDTISMKFYEYYSNDNFKVAIVDRPNKNIEIYNSEGLLVKNINIE